jgi:ABC-type transport system involved in cytochrome c biogenesis ATPase subunit
MTEKSISQQSLKLQDFKLFSEKKIVLMTKELVFTPGTFTYILGSNSAGKSLLLKAISGQYKDYKGYITFKNQKLSLHLKQNNILFINNELPVIEKMTFLENIEIPLGKVNAIQKNRLLEMASIVDIVNLLNHKMAFCCRSERMLMYLVRAALISPNVLLIDDIDTFFDKDKFDGVLQLFAYYQKSGMIILATGKSFIGDVPTYKINNGDIEKLCLQ